MSFEEADRIWSQLRDLIAKEDQLITNWITLLVLVNAAFITGLVALDIPEVLTEVESQSPDAVLVMGLMISLAGFLASLFFMLSLQAAWSQLRYLREEYDRKSRTFSEFGFTRPFGSSAHQSWFGELLFEVIAFFRRPYVLSFMFIAFWTAAVGFLWGELDLSIPRPG